MAFRGVCCTSPVASALMSTCVECRSEVLGTPETPMPQVRPLMPPPLFDAAQAPGSSAAHAAQAAQQPSHGAQGPRAEAAAPAALDVLQASHNCTRGDDVDIEAFVLSVLFMARKCTGAADVAQMYIGLAALKIMTNRAASSRHRTPS